MRLDQLLNGLSILDMANIYEDMEISSITADSREVTPGSIFVAIHGTQVDGHEYVKAAVESGATLIIQSKPLEPKAVGAYLRVAEPRKVYATLCARLNGNPSKRLRVIGVTGTNGKTSTTLLIRHLLNMHGYNAAALGTLGLLRPNSEKYEARGLTTPDAGKLQELMRQLADEGATHLVMEVSSHALSQERVHAIEFAGGVFTNLSQDHFDYHETIEQYREAKARLFTELLAYTGGYAVFNGDDATGREFANRFCGIGVVFGSQPEHHLVFSDIKATAAGLNWEFIIKNGVWPDSLDRNVNHALPSVPLTGRYNVENCMAAIGVALLEGLGLKAIVDGLHSFPGIPGRLERVPGTQGINVFVDYAHTPDAVANVLSALVELKGSGRLICVVGCGGDRDRAKRPQMGAIAQRLSDLTIITSDNPRTEDPEAIINQIMAGIDPTGPEVLRETGRRLAIQLSIDRAEPGDIVLIAGKGHEDYQIIGTETVYFSDLEEVMACFA